MKGLKGYLKEAQVIIVKWGPIGLLYDDECVGYVAGKLLEADWKYDPEKGASQTTWRILCGRWAIYNWIRQRKQQVKKAPVSLNSVSPSGNSEVWETLADERNLSESREEINIEQPMLRLSTIQREYILKHFREGISMSDIAKEKGITRQAVSISIKGAVEKLKSELNRERIKNEAPRKTSR